MLGLIVDFLHHHWHWGIEKAKVGSFLQAVLSNQVLGILGRKKIFLILHCAATLA
jgi:hypothetical protein